MLADTLMPRALLLTLLWSLVPMPLWAQAQSALNSTDPLVARRETKATLDRIQEASSQRNYHGTVVVSAGSMVTSSRISHFCEGRHQIERIDALDGPPRHVVRRGEQVHTVWPERQVAMVEQRDQFSSFPALLQAGAQQIPDFYRMQAVGEERVAGRDAQLIFARAKDRYRYSYRLWMDKSSGLLLRSETLSETGQVLESSAFSEVTIGSVPSIETLLEPVHKLDGFRVVQSRLSPVRLEAQGWRFKTGLPGFRQVACVKRSGENPLKASTSTFPQVTQVIYSDGLTYVSIFIEPYHAGRHNRPLQTVMGSTQTLLKRQGDWWVTLMGDVPPATLRQFADSLERTH